MSGLAVALRARLPGFELDVAWEIGAELAVLFGPSGAGKSLTLRLIAGLARPDAGRVVAGEHLLLDTSRAVCLPPQQRSIGYVFQDLALFPHMTVLENVLSGGHGLEREELFARAESLIRRFGLASLQRRRPGEISGGQKQRVAFARALLRRPSVLLLDEPFSALDASLRRDMGGLLREVQRELKVPAVLVTHDHAEASTLADTVILYNGGCTTRQGTPQESLDFRTAILDIGDRPATMKSEPPQRRKEMKRTLTRLSALSLFALVPFLAACSDDEAPSSHTVSLGGVKHQDGYTDPNANCVGCHGTDLRGGSGPSCYSCHNNDSHTDSRSGVRHAEDVDCSRCHGPNNTGGLGPACTECH